jgi:hypothetical protein
MGYLMGDDETFCTWGAMRSPMHNGSWPDNLIPPNFLNNKTIHNREYEDEGDGVTYPPTFFVDDSGSMFRCQPVGFGIVGSEIRWPQAGSPSSWNGYMVWAGLDNQDFDQFLGALLSSPTDSVNLTASAYTAAGQYVEFTPPFNIDLSPGFSSIDGMAVLP